jgi:hypothetical protein
MTGIRFRFYRLVPESGAKRVKQPVTFPVTSEKRGKEAKELVRRLVTERNNVR